MAASNTKIQTNEVVATAAIVPVGIAFDASAKSPDRFEPAMIPNQKHTTWADQQPLMNVNEAIYKIHSLRCVLPSQFESYFMLGRVK